MNSLHILLIFSFLNFIACGIPIDVSELVTYAGQVKYYNLENKTIEDIPAEKYQRTDLSSVSVLLDPGKIQPEGPNYKLLGPSVISIIPAAVNGRTELTVNNEKVNQFLSHVLFSTGDVNTLSTLRLIMYYIVDNPIGCELIGRILGGIGNKMILFKVEGAEFMYLPSSDRNPMENIIIPNVIFSGYKAQRQDITSYGPQQDGESWKFFKHERPFYVGLVHELIHLMHNLENKRTGENENGNLLYSDDFGGRDLWGDGDDLHTIWGVYSIDNGLAADPRCTLNYDLVSELTFRIHDKIPIRMFYETIDLFTRKISLDRYVDDINKPFEDEEGNEVEPLEILKKILTCLGQEKIITISA